MADIVGSCLHHGPLTRVRPRHSGFIAWLLRLCTGGRRRDRAVHWPDRFRFRTPAQGDAYDFTVIVHFTWCITGRESGDRLVLRAVDQHTALLEHAMARVRNVARDYPPYDVTRAERAIGRALSDTLSAARFPYLDGEIRVITARTRVKQAGPVLEIAQDAWRERQRAENAHELATMVAKRLGVRRELWRDFLRTGETDWLTPYAVSLAQDSGKAAQTVQTMFDQRRSQVRELGSEVVRQVEDYRDADAFELMIDHDTVLRRLMDLLQIPRPAPAAISPFSDESGNGSDG